MELDVSRLLDRTVTVFNRLSAKDSGAAADAYVPTVLTPASWSETVDRSTDSDGTVHLTRSVRVQVPASTAEYLPYREWVEKAAESATGGVYTVSLGDYVALGELPVSGHLSRSEVLKALEGTEHVTVSAFRDLTGNGGVSACGACGKYATVVYMEGR